MKSNEHHIGGGGGRLVDSGASEADVLIHGRSGCPFSLSPIWSDR